MRKFLILIASGIALIVLVLFFQGRAAAQKVDALSFSNTAEWGPSYYAQVSKQTSLVSQMENMISIPPPPANSSPQTKEEIALLLSYKELRTPERMEKIHDEILPETTEFGGRMASDYFDPKQFPLTAPLLKRAFDDLNIVLFKLKNKYDRVRPGVLEPNIAPAIEVPGHPAYPSGHSTQAHFIAYFLSELAPEHREEFEKRALEVAMNREVAGLHYTSDTLAGRMVARQFLDILLNNPDFQERFEAAQTEW